MKARWTFGQKLGASFAVLVLLSVVIGAVSVLALRRVVESKDEVIARNARNLIEAQRLSRMSEQKSAAVRAYLLTRDEQFTLDVRDSRSRLAEILAGLREGASDPESGRLVEAVAEAEADYRSSVERVFDAVRRGGDGISSSELFNREILPRRNVLEARLQEFVAREDARLEDARALSTATAREASTTVIVIAAVSLLFAIVAAVVLTRTLSRQIGAAVAQVQSSSSELQAAANQQATGAREQATAMAEITTTITELLATSRQIAESAQRVAQIASQTAGSARTGTQTVDGAQTSVTAIRRQVDQIVTHMLELGKKSQQIGSVVDIVSELAEQTNILAINATIEAAGAGEAGRRFAIVADEIRKLADRVAGSTKEIRGLIDDVRGATNTTVMATESGSKAVDAGARQFGDVAAAFSTIATLVATTTEAAREIELSTKQQATAVEQVNLAIANVAQATKETETSSTQTLQTASELAGLSRELLQMTQPQASA